MITRKVYRFYYGWSQGEGHVIATHGGFAILMTELYTFVIRIRKGLTGKKSKILRAAIHGNCFPNGVYVSTCTISLLHVLTKTAVQELGSSVMALDMHTKCFCSSVSIANILPLVLSVFLVLVRLWTDAFCTISIGTCCKLYRSVFFPAGEIPFIILSIKEIPIKTDTAKYLTVPNMARILASPMRTRSTVALMVSTFCFVALCSDGFS